MVGIFGVYFLRANQRKGHFYIVFPLEINDNFKINTIFNKQ